jgi:hypothetical protein
MLPSWKPAVFPALFCLLVTAFLFSTACSPLTSDSPPLPDSTFTRVLVDVHFLSARQNRAAPLPPDLRDSLLAHHGVQREDVQATLRYYTRHPDDFANLYNAVIDTLKAIGNRRRYERLPDSVRQQMSGDALKRSR